jgi:hypothetical protein
VIEAITFAGGPLVNPTITFESYTPPEDQAVPFNGFVVTLTHTVQRDGAALEVQGSTVVWLPEDGMEIVRRIWNIAQDLMKHELKLAIHFQGDRAII